MPSALSEIMSREARRGLRRLAGTRVDATLVATEAVLLDALRRFTRIPRTFSIRIEAHNRLVLSYAGFTARATVDDAIDVGQKRLQLWLESVAIGWALRLLVRWPGISVAGRRVTIDFEQLWVNSEYRLALDHVRAARLSTTDGRVTLRVEVVVS